MGRSIYLDYNATAPVRPEAKQAVADALDLTGNASSVHAQGRAARRRIETARAQVAALVGAGPEQVVFTSGGTEANNLALRGLPVRSVLVSAGEHDSVLEAVAGTTLVPLRPDGLVDLEALAGLLAAAEPPALVSVMLANNETGVIQPLGEVVALARGSGALVHCDAVQAAGKIPVDWTALGVDALTLSAHKLGGPQGVGALVLGAAAATAQIAGGAQEGRRRAGTENLPGIAGFGAAAESALRDLDAAAGLAVPRDRLEAGLRALAPEAAVFGADAPRLPNTTCVALPGLGAETQVMALDLAGIAVSAGSACSSGKVRPSHVLLAMGADPALAGGAIRVSLGRDTAAEEIEAFLAAWTSLYHRHAERTAGVASVA